MAKKAVKKATALSRVQKYFPKVKTVRDAKADIRIEVQKQDQHPKGRKDHETCALATACKRKLKLHGVVVARSVMYLIKGNNAIRYTVPENVTREIIAFDRGADFVPGEYRLKKPSKDKQLGACPGGHNRDSSGNGKPKKEYHATKGIRAILGSKV